MDKNTARRTGFSRRSFLTEEERRSGSEIIQQKIIEAVRDCRMICTYVSMRDEVCTEGIITYCLKHGIRVLVPKTAGNTLEFHEIASMDDLAPGMFGVREPVTQTVCPLRECDLVLVPLSAFDDGCRRTGWGMGYYDSVLAEARRTAGLAFEVQRVGRIESDPWDIPLDAVYTEKGMYTR